MRQKQSKNIQQQQLQQFLALKPNRAVQRLLQQNQIRDSFQLYQLLQENIKSNTTQLRSVLYNKHQNLYQCSEMINQIQNFTLKIKCIQQEIDTLLNSQVEKENVYNEDDYLINPVNKIQQLMNHKQFSQALKQCAKVIQEASVREDDDQDSNLYYIKFLKVQIVQKLQAHIENHPLTKNLISETIAALTQFMRISSPSQISEYLQCNLIAQSVPKTNPYAYQQFEQENSLLYHLNQKYHQIQEKSRKYPLSSQQILQAAFKFKLLSIKFYKNRAIFPRNEQKQRIETIYNRIVNYFGDLLKLLQQSKQKDDNINGCKNLYRIFSINIKKTINSISQLFIRDEKKQMEIFSQNNLVQNPPNQILSQNQITLTFESDLYEKLLRSEAFIKIINDLQEDFDSLKQLDQKQDQQKKDQSKNNEFKIDKNQEIRLMSMIKNLWRDFYRQLLEIITQKINPLCYNKINFSVQSKYKQLKRFSVVNIEKVTKQNIATYNKQLSVLINNLDSVLSKSRSLEQKGEILKYYLDLKEQLQNKCATWIQAKKQNVNDRRSKSKIQKNLRIQNRHNKNSGQHIIYELQIRQLISLYLLVQNYNNLWHSILNDQTLSKNYSHLSNSLTINSFKCESLYFNLFTSQNKSQNGHSNSCNSINSLFQIVNSYIDYKIDSKVFLKQQYIQNWQLQLDIFFSYYTSKSIQDSSLIQKLKLLILTLIKTKIQSIR